MIEDVDRVLVSDGVLRPDPASVRPRLAEGAAAGLDEIQRTLLDAALGAVSTG